ncbi:hypothetical protein WN944_028315 [Citrus x changshan-huyou]|uniref:Calcineurin-like phosphoesterase domain-containing protein n=1 Tax=Citrus x changshan-huyou TaxID=2935761 RepID=A0AAP0Q998_9ROSI
MASLCMNSLPLPPSSHSKKLALTEASSSSNGSIAAAATASKPIVVSGNTPTFVSAPGRRIVAVGDLHGDLDQARCALEMAGVLSSDGLDLWTGGESVLIQLGDVLDRGEDELAILSLLRSLDMQAKAEGGAVFQVNGNHETMNVEGDFRYVDSGGFDECSDFLEYLNDYENDWEEAFVGWVGMSERWKEDRRLSRNYWGPLNLVKEHTCFLMNTMFDAKLLITNSFNLQALRGKEEFSFSYAEHLRIISDDFSEILGQRQKGVIARSVLFRPGGPMACELARHGVVLKVNDWVFCHGGLLPHHVRSFILFEIPDRNVGVSTVAYGLERMNNEQINAVLQDTLRAVGAKAMVVGHTPQFAGANCEYNCSIWRIDVGMSSGVLNSRPEVRLFYETKVSSFF